MALWGDERGQSTQIGAVLLFGFLVVSTATYQSAVVPAQNGDVEFSHSQAVQDDLQRVHDAALRTAATGVRQSTSVALGTRYPSRTLFVNPPAPSGSLRTTGEFSTGYGIYNARTTGEAGDYWDGDWRVVESEALVYAPGYHEYRSPPETVVEGGLVYNRFDDATVPLTDGSLVDGRTVTLVALDGSRSASRGGVTSVGTEPLSVSTTTVPVRSADGDPIRLYVLTMASESAWRETLSDELAEGNVEEVEYYSNEQLRAYGAGIDDVVGEDVSLDRGQGAAVVHLNANRTYDLRMAKVGVGSGAETPGPAYLTAVDPLDRGLVPGVGDTVVVEVRDRFNNPVSGVEVTANVSSRLAVDAPLGNRSDADGRIRYSVTPTETGNVSASFAIGDEASKTVAYDRRVTDGTGFDDGDDGPVRQPTVVVYPALSTGAGGDGADSIPPNGTYGSLSGFDQMGDDDSRTAKLSTDYINNTVKQALRHGVSSRSVPARSTYELEIRYFFDNGQGTPVDVAVVTAEEETLQTVRLNPQTRSETGGNGEEDTYLLNAEATEYVRSNGEFYLVFDAPPDGTDGTYFNLYVDYVRLRGSE